MAMTIVTALLLTAPPMIAPLSDGAQGRESHGSAGGAGA
jgi:hypothetical protein